MSTAHTARLWSLHLSRRTAAITAAVLALLIIAMSAVNAMPCFETAGASAATEHAALFSQTHESTSDDCEEKPLFAVSILKIDDAKHLMAAAQPAADSSVIHDDFPNHSTRGAILVTDKAPLFLQTGRLRI